MSNRWTRVLSATLAAAFLLLFSLAGAPLTHADGISQAPDDSLQPMEAQLLDMLNSERAAAGVPALTIDGSLEDIARQRSNDMATRDYFSHVTPEGTMVFDQMNAEGIPYQLAAENIARDNAPQDQAAAVAHQGFVNSPEHAQNDQDPSFNKVGIGAAVAGDGTVYFTELFAELPN